MYSGDIARNVIKFEKRRVRRMKGSRSVPFVSVILAFILALVAFVTPALPAYASVQEDVAAPFMSQAAAEPVSIERGASMLSADQKKVYDALKSGYSEQAERIDFISYKPGVEEVNYIISSLLNAEPEFFYVDAAYSYSTSESGAVSCVFPKYLYTGDALTQAKNEYDRLVSEIIAEASYSWSDLEKTLFVHDYIVKNFVYDVNYEIYDAYKFLVEKTGVCQSYTLLASELLGRLGVESDSVASTEMNHVWNCVKIDGEWYHMDITHDDPVLSGTGADFFDEVYYNNFLCGDDAIKNTGHYGWSVGYTFSDSYDHLFIKSFDVQTKIDISPLGEDWYILVGTKKEPMGVHLGRIDFESNSYTSIEFLDCIWMASQSSYYSAVYAGLGRYHDSLVISTADSLYAYNPTHDSIEYLASCAYSEGDVYGMVINGSVATLRVADEPSNYEGSLFFETDLSEILFNVKVRFTNTLGSEIAPTYNARIGWGKEFSVSVPEIEGYTTSSYDDIEGTVPLGGVDKEIVYGAYRTLRIDYVYENGEKAHESYIDNYVEIGERYSVVSPSIAKYNPDIAKVEGVMGDSGVNITVVYSHTTYTVKINYVYSNGQSAGDSVIRENLEYGDKINVNSPVIGGYTADKTVVSLTVDKDIEINVTYTPIRCKLTVEYVYSNGDLIEKKESVMDWGSSYEITTPKIQGYTPDKSVVSGVLKKENEKITVTYTLDRHTLVIIYLYESGDTAYETYVRSDIGYGESYSVKSPVIDGYESSVDTVSGIAESDITVSVIYRKTRFKISFTVDGEVFFSYEATRAEDIVLPDTLPEKAPSVSTVYAFLEWKGYSDSLTVEGDAEFEAVFSEKPRVYKVVFENYDNTKLYETYVEYGKAAVYVGEAPTRATEQGVVYTFVGWSDDIEFIGSDLTVHAMFSDGVTKYKITFYDEKGNVIKVEEVFYGENATPPAAPEKASDNKFSYTFDGWVGKYKKVTANAEIRPSYKSTYIEYRIVFKNYDGSVIFALTLHYGDSIPYVDIPERESDGQFDYLFESWTPELPDTVTRSAEYTAVFIAEPKHEKTAADLKAAVDAILSAKTLSERFECIREACEIRDKIYLEDPDAREPLDVLESEIARYNADIKSVNDGFAKANQSELLLNTFSGGYLTVIVLIWTVIKRLFGI